MKVHPDQPPPDMLSMKGGLKRYEQQHAGTAEKPYGEIFDLRLLRHGENL
jgi:hypothetical protein